MPDININSAPGGIGPASSSDGDKNSASPSDLASNSVPAAQNSASKTDPLQNPSGVMSFQDIFSQKSSAEASKTDEPKMMESFLVDKTAANKAKPILGDAPTLHKNIQKEQEYELKKKLRSRQWLLAFISTIALIMVIYFYTQLSPTFNLLGQNTMAKVYDLNKNLRGLQTQLNKYRYLAAQVELNRFSALSDQFLDKVSIFHDPQTPADQQSALSADIAELQKSLPKTLERIKNYLNQSIVVATHPTPLDGNLSEEEMVLQAENELRTALKNDRAELSKNASNQQNEDQIKLIDNTLKLVGNKKLLTTIKGVAVDTFTTDLESYRQDETPEKRKALQTAFSSILSSTKSDISTIATLKNGRIGWSNIIQQIEAVTGSSDVDPFYGKGVFEAVGHEILYTGYEFDASSKKIVLSGITRTLDATNFTLITKLIDGLEKSFYFMDVDMRSFTKSGSYDTGFMANFKIDLQLESDGNSEKNQQLSLMERVNEEVTSGVRRTMLPAETKVKRISN